MERLTMSTRASAYPINATALICAQTCIPGTRPSPTAERWVRRAVRGEPPRSSRTSDSAGWWSPANCATVAGKQFWMLVPVTFSNAMLTSRAKIRTRTA